MWSLCLFLGAANWIVVWDIQRISETFVVILGQFESAALSVPGNKEFVLAAAESCMKVFLVFVWWCGDVFSVVRTPWDFECDNACSVCVIEHGAW